MISIFAELKDSPDPHLLSEENQGYRTLRINITSANTSVTLLAYRTGRLSRSNP
jgi:hypothetical protein